MHDKNGKAVHVGDDITTHAFGLCTIIGVEAEDNELEHGANVRVRDQKGEEYCLRLRLAGAVKVRSWKELAQEALQVQDACNLSGVVHSFSTIITEVRTRLEGEGKGGTNAVNSHPVCRLYADKIAHLTGTQSFSSTEGVHTAYGWAHDIVERKK